METVTRITVFAGSPGDANPERDHVQQVIQDLNDIGIGGGRVTLDFKRWETHAWPGFGEDPQDVINHEIGEFDIFVGIMWNRLGTPTRRAGSGTVEEFERAYEKWKLHRRPSLLFYFNTAPAAFSELEQIEQKRQVILFQQKLKNLGALYWEYQSVEEFTRFLRKHLYKEVQRMLDTRLQPTLPHHATESDAESDHIRQLAKKLGYWHTGLTSRILQDIEHAAADSASPHVRQSAITALLEFLLTGLQPDNEEATERARDLRVHAFQVLRRCAGGDFAITSSTRNSKPSISCASISPP